MTLRSYRTFQTLVLACLGLFLFWKVSDGTILLYLNKRYVLPVFLGSLVLVILSQVVLRERPSADAPENSELVENRQKWSLWWLSLPVILGLLIPSRPLGSAAVANRGISLSNGYSTNQKTAVAALNTPENDRSLLDWIRITSLPNELAAVKGKEVDITGFVYHDIRLQPGEFLVGRFAVTCCVADAYAIGMVVVSPDAGDLHDNQWVQVRGKIDVLTRDGKDQPVIRGDEIVFIPEPKQPYLFP